MVMHSITYPVNVSKIIQAVILLMTLFTPAVAIEKDVWRIVFDFQMELARHGNPAAQEKVGEMLEEGRGVKQDFVKARQWYHKAANQGHKGAISKLNGLPARIKLHKASKANTKGQEANREQLIRERAAKEKATREYRLREQRTAEKIKAARAKALREQRAMERIKAARAKALREQRAEQRAKSARVKALREQQAEKRKKMSGKQKPYKQGRLTESKRPGTAAKLKSVQDDGQADKREDSQVFKANPCKGKAARFMSTCKNK